MTLPVPHLAARQVTLRVLYPAGGNLDAAWDAPSGQLTVSLPRTPSACVLALTG